MISDARITGVVRDSSGTPISGAVVMLGGASPPHPDIAAVTDATGLYRFGGLAPGVYTVIVNAEGRSPERRDVAAVSGEDAHLDFTLEPA